MIRCFAAALISVVAVTCAGSQESRTPVRLDKKQVSAVKSAVAMSLKDPDSAKFGPKFSASSSGGEAITVCGLVNAKNSYGGYTGMKPFLGLLSGKTNSFYVKNVASNEIETTAAHQTCEQFGAPIN